MSRNRFTQFRRREWKKKCMRVCFHLQSKQGESMLHRSWLLFYCRLCEQPSYSWERCSFCHPASLWDTGTVWESDCGCHSSHWYVGGIQRSPRMQSRAEMIKDQLKDQDLKHHFHVYPVFTPPLLSFSDSFFLSGGRSWAHTHPCADDSERLPTLLPDDRPMSRQPDQRANHTVCYHFKFSHLQSPL